MFVINIQAKLFIGLLVMALVYIPITRFLENLVALTLDGITAALQLLR